MVSTGQYKLRKAAGGASHFAHVEVGVYPAEGQAQDLALDCPPTWVAAALDGGQSAIRLHPDEAFQSALVKVLRCVGTLADTDVDTVWCAAFLATQSALGVSEQAQPDFEQRTWRVALADGRYLSPPPAILRQAAYPRDT